ANDNDFAAISGTAYTAITDVLTVTLAGGESLYGTAPLDYWVGGTSSVSRATTATWQYSPAGAGTWSDFDTAITGSFAVGGYAAESGSGDFSQVKGGLSAGDYDVRLVAKLNAAGTTVSFFGTATVESKV